MTQVWSPAQDADACLRPRRASTHLLRAIGPRHKRPAIGYHAVRDRPGCFRGDDGSMKAFFKRLAVQLVGWAFIVVGIIGLFLPILQGILFILIGLIILSTQYSWAHGLMQRIRARFPRLAQKSHEASVRARQWLDRIWGRREEPPTPGL